jgi:uncharacterized protein (TIGR03083 family)
MLDASSIGDVLSVYLPERASLLALLDGLSSDDWVRPTECPAYTVKGVATHVLGDDLSLLSRQRDSAKDGLSLLALDMPGADFRTLLNGFNDRWVAAARFFSPELLIELLRLTGEWTAEYYESVEPDAPGEAVGLFGTLQGASSPFWQAIAREFTERWIHHSQIRRAVALPSLAARQFLVPGFQVAAAIARMEPAIPGGSDGIWALGPVVLGSAQQTADLLTRAHTTDEVRELLDGPAEVVARFAALLGRS